MSNVPPPRSYTAMMPACRLSSPYASDAAVGSLMMRSTSRPAMRPASRVAVRCASLKYAGTVMTARSTSLSNSPCAAKNASARCFSSRSTNAEISGAVNSLSPRPILTTASPEKVNGKRFTSSRTSARPLPMKRFTEYAVRAGAVNNRRCASRPTKIVPDSSTETIDGTSPSPLASRMTSGLPSLTYATSELVVPRSMPTTLLTRSIPSRCSRAGC